MRQTIIPSCMYVPEKDPPPQEPNLDRPHQATPLSYTIYQHVYQMRLDSCPIQKSGCPNEARKPHLRSHRCLVCRRGSARCRSIYQLAGRRSLPLSRRRTSNQSYTFFLPSSSLIRVINAKEKTLNKPPPSIYPAHSSRLRIPQFEE